jgi:thiol-disulfide isomerase/thioredoxin
VSSHELREILVNRRFVVRAAATAGLAVTLAGCGGSGSSLSAAPPPTIAVPSAKVPLSASGSPKAGAVPEQLAFTAKTVDGANFDGKSLAGKPVVLWFWAPWCSICRGEAPDIAKTAAANPGVTFVGVAGLGEVSAMKGFVSDTGLGNLTHLADLDGSLWSRFGVAAQPAQAFIATDGTMTVVKGSMSGAELEAKVKALAA